MRVIWSQRALERVEEIAGYIAQDSPSAAVRWTKALFDQVEELGEFPGMGKPARDVATPGIRELVLGEYRVFYEEGADVDVHSVRHGSQLVDEDEFARD